MEWDRDTVLVQLTRELVVQLLDGRELNADTTVRERAGGWCELLWDARSCNVLDEEMLAPGSAVLGAADYGQRSAAGSAAPSRGMLDGIKFGGLVGGKEILVANEPSIGGLIGVRVASGAEAC